MEILDAAAPNAAGEGGTSSTSHAGPSGGEETFLDLFAGAGGLSIGLEAAGLRTLGAVEVLEDAARTYEKIHQVEVDRRPLEEIPAGDLRAFRGRVRLVAGGPPCQPWSTGGLRRGDDDVRDGFSAMFRALDLIKPDAFVIENVAGLERGKSRPYFFSLLEVLEDPLGYEVMTRTLDAADFGAPQHRRRTFIVGTRGCAFEFPTPTHGPDRGEPWVSAGEVLSEDPIGEPNTSIVTYAKNPDLRPSAYDGLLFNGGGRPIDLEAPARTILASAGGNKTPFIDTLGVVPEYHRTLWDHYKSKGHKGLARLIRKGLVPGARRITVAESAALQTFDSNVTFYGRRSTQYTLVGNAVPPRLAAAVGRQLVRALEATTAR